MTRRSGPGWLLVGDAAGFLDPFTGEGLHRALVSAELAAAAIIAGHRGTVGSRSQPRVRRLRPRDAAPVPRQGRGLVARPGASSTRPILFDYAARRVAARPSVRATMGLVMGDLIPASRALDPRFLASLLAP